MTDYHTPLTSVEQHKSLELDGLHALKQVRNQTGIPVSELIERDPISWHAQRGAGVAFDTKTKG